MKAISIAICDDDKMALTVISAAVRSIFDNHGILPQIKLFSGTPKLREELDAFSPHLIMLDVSLSQIDGIQFVKQLRKAGNKADVIFVSASEHRVFETLEVRPFGFVRKSCFLKDMSDTVSRYIDSKRSEGPSETVDLPVRGGSRIHVPVSDIVYFEGDGMYQRLFLRNGRQEEISSRMDHLEQSLAAHGFMRIHKGYLVNYRYIARLEKSEATLSGGKKIPISRRKTKEIRQQYLQLGKDRGVLLL